MANTQSAVSVKSGKLTYIIEGNNNNKSRNYSRVIHYPEKILSGVTIGRGYDMGKRTKHEIYTDLINAGIDQRQANAMSMAAGLKGAKASEFVKNYRNSIGEITEKQQINLFNNIFPEYIRRAKIAYEKKTKDIQKKPRWEDLHPAIRDVLIDIVYQGFQGDKAMPAATKNDIDYLINLIRSTPDYIQYEPSRGRAKYLDKNR